jgi:hypothetical protein
MPEKKLCKHKEKQIWIQNKNEIQNYKQKQIENKLPAYHDDALVIF